VTAVRRQRERGSLTLEFAIIAPAVLVLIGLAVVGGRVVVAGGAVDQAAAAAAREASISRDAVSAQARGVRIAQETLQNQDLDCRDVTVDLDLSAFAQPVGTSGAVRATVSCLVGLEGLGVPGVPGQRRLEGTATSVIDRYRQR
jgi:Flp pilus assembly protein TadG